MNFGAPWGFHTAANRKAAGAGFPGLGASALREAPWSADSETCLALDVDYVADTDEHLGRFEQAYEGFQRLAGQA